MKNLHEEVGNYDIEYSHLENDGHGNVNRVSRTASVVGRSADHAKAQFLNGSAAMLHGFELHSVSKTKPLSSFMKESLEDDKKLLLTYRSDAHKKKAEIAMAGGRLSNFYIAKSHSNLAKVAKLNGDKQAFRIHSDLAQIHNMKHRYNLKNNTDND